METGATAELLRHRQTKEAATDRLHLTLTAPHSDSTTNSVRPKQGKSADDVILFSNGSRAGGSVLSEFDAFGVACVLCVLVRHLMGSAGCEAAWLKSQPVCDRMLQNRRRHSLPPLDVAPTRELGSASCLLAGDWLRQLELSAVFQHRMHDDGEPSGERDPGFSHGGAFGDGEGPILELQRPLEARQQHIRGLIKKRPHPAVAAFGDAAGVVHLA